MKLGILRYYFLVLYVVCVYLYGFRNWMVLGDVYVIFGDFRVIGFFSGFFFVIILVNYEVVFELWEY